MVVVTGALIAAVVTIEDEAGADEGELELLRELTGADEDTGGCGGIGGTKYCG